MSSSRPTSAAKEQSYLHYPWSRATLRGQHLLTPQLFDAAALGITCGGLLNAPLRSVSKTRVERLKIRRLPHPKTPSHLALVGGRADRRKNAVHAAQYSHESQRRAHTRLQPWSVASPPLWYSDVGLDLPALVRHDQS